MATEGQTAVNRATGERAVFTGGRWVKQGSAPASQMPTNPEFQYKGPQAAADLNKTGVDTTRTITQTQGDVLDNAAKSRAITQNPISESDQKFINDLRGTALGSATQLRDITAAQEAVDRFQPSPGRGSLYSWGVPEADDWPTTSLLKSAVGAFLPQQSKEDYQTLLGLQNRAVLAEQASQKGPQTEADATRMALAGVSPFKDVRPNAKALAEAQYDAMMKQQQPEFFTYWANKLGSINTLNGQGQTAAQVWADQYQKGLGRLRSNPSYTGKRGMFGNRPQSKASQSTDDDEVAGYLKKYGN